MFLFILWSLLTLSSFWFAVCVLLNASVRERDPASWHYRFIYFVGEKGEPPENSCDYFRALFLCPYVLLLFCISICSVALSYLFLDFFWRPFIFGSYSKYRKYDEDKDEDEDEGRSFRNVTANPFKRHYWKKVIEHEPRGSYGNEFLPFPLYYLYILALVIWGFITFVPYVPSLFTPGSDSLTAICTLLLIIGVCACVVSVVILRPKIKALWEVLTNKLCFDLPLKQNSEPAESE